MATYQVEFAYSGVEDDELTLEVGDVINNCATKEDGWLEGEINGRRGMFPDNFVKKIAHQIISPKAKQAPPPIPSNKPKGLKPTQSKRPVYKALFAYRSENGDELTFEEGQKIYFVQEVEDGWARGELDDGSAGLYPTNFVQAAPELDVDKEVVSKPDIQVKTTNKPKKEATDGTYYKVAFEYHADNSDELSLSVGDIIKVLKKESADEGWWEGENYTSGSVGVFPKNFMDQTPIPAPGTKSTPAGNTNTGGPINRINKTVIMRDTKQTNKDIRRNIVSDMPVSTNKPIMMDNDKVKNRPKGPNNRRPPKKKAMDDRNPTSPLEENPPMEDQLESKIKVEASSSPAPAGAPAQNRSPMMPAINFGSLRKKQTQMGLRSGPEKPVDTNRSISQTNASPPGPTSAPTSVPASEESAIPPWKKELQAKKRGKSIKPTSTIPEKPPTNDAQQPPPWVKEMEKKKSSFTREDIKPDPAVKKEPVVTSSTKPQPIAGTRSSFRPSAPSTNPSGSSFASAQSVTSTPPPTAPHKAQSSTVSSATSGGGEPTMSDLLREIQSLKSHVQTLSRRLDDESNLRTMLEKKVNSLQRD